MSWVVPPEWTGEAVFILGCGPSLALYNFHTLQSLKRYGKVIAINDAYMRVTDADVLYFCDAKWWTKNAFDVSNRFTGRRLVTMDNEIPKVKTVRCTGENGLETDPAGIRHGSNSGYQVLNLAYHLGVNRIILLGYDMRTHGAKLHWRERSDMQTQAGFSQTIQQCMIPNFPTIAGPLKEAGICVVNATPHSALTVWPYAPIQEVFSNIDNRDFWRGIFLESSPNSEVRQETATGDF